MLHKSENDDVIRHAKRHLLIYELWPTFDDMFKTDVIFIAIEVGSGDRTLGVTWSCEAELFKVFPSHCISSHDTEIKCVKYNYTCFT